MFKKLKDRWQVNNINLVLIICTFAIGGSLCGLAARKLIGLTEINKGFIWVLLYILLVTLFWPFCVLLISIPFGQFKFFIKYLVKIWHHMSGNQKTTVSIAIFASGAGSNAEMIIERMLQPNKKLPVHFSVDLIVCNKPGAGVLNIAAKHSIDTLVIDKERFFRGDGYTTELNARGIQFIVLAGFLWKVPVSLIQAYPHKIINIHPALLPKYGGKGMYGDKVHGAIIEAGEKESGITIHYVDELYDHGNIIFQATCVVDKNDTSETLAQKIHLLEHRHYPDVIEDLIQMQNSR
jgi:formyltetrahydrofolate-dependent phosphoribosylglycinamide formyltransferase